jgi:hypothetical protein
MPNMTAFIPPPAIHLSNNPPRHRDGQACRPISHEIASTKVITSDNPLGISALVPATSKPATRGAPEASPLRARGLLQLVCASGSKGFDVELAELREADYSDDYEVLLNTGIKWHVKVALGI